MSRYNREAKMKALMGEKGYDKVLVTELGGRKRDRKKMLMREFQEGSLHDPTARVPGQDDVFDAIGNVMFGGNETTFNEAGRGQFQNVPTGSLHHATMAEESARRYGFLPTQIGGLAVEGIEHLMGSNRSPQGIEDTKADLVANLMGGLTGVLPESLRPKGRQLTDWVMGFREGAENPSSVQDLPDPLLRVLQGGGIRPRAPR